MSTTAMKTVVKWNASTSDSPEAPLLEPLISRENKVQ
jgi:hypothetical protein